MVAPPQSRLQSMLRAAVQSVQWTYSLFWRLCPQEGILEWSDGYYNGAIKTRKTVQPTAAEEEAVHRSHQLRELYDFLVAGESSHQSRRPSVMLSPEDLTECEWFYLMCVSFSFRPGVGWPGKAYEKQEHVWLVGTNEVDSKICPRAVLAKSASMQTLVCIPLLDGVVELGTVEWVEEDIGIVQHIKSFFTDFHVKPALSDHSTSRPSVSFPPQTDGCHVSQDKEGDDATESDQTGGSDGQSVYDTSHQAAEGDELIMQQLDISMDIRVGSQDQGLNDLDSDFSLSMGTTPPKNSFDLRHEEEVYAPAEAVQRWQTIQPCHSGTQTVISCFHEPTQEDAHHSHTVSTELQPTQWQNSSSTTTAFTKYSAATGHHRGRVHSSQRVLKYILFTVPFLHTKSNDSSASTAQEQSSGSHVLAERRRREKLNERFVMLRSLIPFVTKMDKASILGDAIEYLKQLVEKIQELEAEPKQRNFKEKRGVSLRDKKRRRISEDVGGRKNPAPPHTAEQVEVSIIESEALVEIKCSHKEGLLMNVIQMLRKFKIEVTSVRSSVENGIFASELRAKVRDGVKGRKPTIMEVKRAINRII